MFRAMRLHARRALTIIELLLVVVIVTVLAVVAVPTFFGARDDADVVAVRSDLTHAFDYVRQYRVFQDTYGSTSQDLVDYLAASMPNIAFEAVAGDGAAATSNLEVGVAVFDDGKGVWLTKAGETIRVTSAGVERSWNGPGGKNGGSFPTSLPALNAGGVVRAAVSDGAGGWYIGGSFTSVDGKARTNIAHILNNGTVDPAFTVSLGTG